MIAETLDDLPRADFLFDNCMTVNVNGVTQPRVSYYDWLNGEMPWLLATETAEFRNGRWQITDTGVHWQERYRRSELGFWGRLREDLFGR